ncbi:50S ribosomal protein L9 [Candidatus Persebacteraceae bacterium Df01]|jgi:large subunit ribosomal protein L9|uniref:Large ribosomal subunit protein bL9 n=1 Tax=Candidatus Doriopsillibacter californiensis TaxID=2970740 RepID=A0ABT7QMM6_9GAMM|nr:50S ribosomal protein L9 [Candidatus Persebacteraceae bacterium Df01]
MNIILLESVTGLGMLGDIANVRPGYARNYLLPQGKAERATKEAIATFESRRSELEKRQANLASAMKTAGNALNRYLLQMTARAGPDGNLYGSITAAAIATQLNAQKIAENIEIRRGQITLPNGNLKEIGNHEITVTLHPDVVANITVSVLAGSADGKNE